MPPNLIFKNDFAHNSIITCNSISVLQINRFTRYKVPYRIRFVATRVIIEANSQKNVQGNDFPRTNRVTLHVPENCESPE